VSYRIDFNDPYAWSYLGYWLAVHGIPSDEAEDVTGGYESDPWRPAPDSEVVVLTLEKEGAAKLAALLQVAHLDREPVEGEGT
jgi:hypothetical protein